jgi:hypothetical protein
MQVGLMKRADFCVNGERPLHYRMRGSFLLSIRLTQEEIMARKQQKQMLVRKPSMKIADSRRVRFGTGSAPAKVVRSADATIADSGAIRFGTGSAPANLKK